MNNIIFFQYSPLLIPNAMRWLEGFRAKKLMKMRVRSEPEDFLSLVKQTIWTHSSKVRYFYVNFFDF